MLNNKSEKLIIVGSSGSGKDYLLRELDKQGLKISIKVTSRPKRQNEVDGINYHFRKLEDFNNLDLIVSQDFYNDKKELWKYGILKEDFNNSQAFIMTPGEISQIDELTRKGCFVVYLDIDRNIREKRIIKRNDNNDSVMRRLDADDIDFLGFKDYDLKITDPEFDVESIISLMN